MRVEDKALLGSVGLRGLGRGGEASFGIELAEPAWGQGYALEAARVMLDFGYRQLGWHRIWPIARPATSPCCSWRGGWASWCSRWASGRG